MDGLVTQILFTEVIHVENAGAVKQPGRNHGIEDNPLGPDPPVHQDLIVIFDILSHQGNFPIGKIVVEHRANGVVGEQTFPFADQRDIVGNLFFPAEGKTDGNGNHRVN